MHRSRLSNLIIDCRTDDIDAAAQFWAAALGRPIVPEQDPDPHYRSLHEDEGDLRVLVQAVDHDSRVHLDIETDDVDAEVARLEALGATRVRQVNTWWVMQAPTGQRCCVVRPQRVGLAEHGNAWPDPVHLTR